MDDETNENAARILKSIIALLLSLASMAERASGRSRAMCAMMVWILRPTEAVVSAYADLPPDHPFALSADCRTDALRLARRFRLLADELLLEAEFALLAIAGIAYAGPSGLDSSAPTKPDFSGMLDRFRQIAWAERLPNDTS